MKRMIVNADDFGRHVRINEAVEKGVEMGVLRSATLMAGGAAFEDAAARVRRMPHLGLGIHFTLVDGVPLLPPEEIPSLVDETGRFLPSYAAFSKHYAKGGVHLGEVQAELAAQLQKFEAAKLTVDHADSHQHMHVLPGIAEVVIGLCRKAGILALRAPFAPLFAGNFGGVGQFVGRVGLALLAKNAANLARKAGLLVPDHFAGIVAGEAVDEAELLHAIKNLREGTTEVMMHPGTANEEIVRDSGWQHDFEAEFGAILSPKVAKLAAEEGVEIVSFQALGGRIA